MTKRSVRIILNEETYRKYKVYCAMENISMTDMTNKLIENYIKECLEYIKIIRTQKNI